MFFFVLTKKVILILFLCPVFVSSQSYQDFFTMFYNVENMFDTIDNPKKNDNEFLPNSDKKWDTEKYNHKIQQLNRVFSLINNGDLPDVIGLCEIENKDVINDLIDTDFFKNNNYKVIHKESEDFRGIDCALLIDTIKYDLLSFDSVSSNCIILILSFKILIISWFWFIISFLLLIVSFCFSI